MFTGLVETVGELKGLKPRGNYRVLTIASNIPTDQIQLGESIACDGACLTVVAVEKDCFVVEASQESTKRTILGDYQADRKINLERALQVGARLGGHFVSGHIDVVGEVDSMKQVGESWALAIKHDPKYDKLVVDKGSIAINGISLTVNACRSGWFEVNLIPLTVQETSISEVKAKARVNLEFDLIGKYILKMIDSKNSSGVDMNKLLESGW